jgi:hypothetical protein
MGGVVTLVLSFIMASASFIGSSTFNRMTLSSELKGYRRNRIDKERNRICYGANKPPDRSPSTARRDNHRAC